MPDAELVWIALRLTGFEREVISELCRRGAFGGLDDVVRAALWQLARQLDVPISTFGLGRMP